MSKTKLGIISAVIIGSIAAWYFMYFTKTPEYSLNLIKESVENHDIETFKKHVDLDTLLSRGVDDYFTSTISDESDDEISNAFAKGMTELIKPMIVSVGKDKIYQFIEGQSTNNTADSSNKESENKQTENAANDIIQNSELQDVTFNKLGQISIDGKIATVDVLVNVPDIPEGFIFKIKMRQLNDRTWQIAEVINTKEYIQQITEYFTVRKPSIHERKPQIHVRKPLVKNSRFME